MHTSARPPGCGAPHERKYGRSLAMQEHEHHQAERPKDTSTPRLILCRFVRGDEHERDNPPNTETEAQKLSTRDVVGYIAGERDARSQTASLHRLLFDRFIRGDDQKRGNPHKAILSLIMTPCASNLFAGK